MRHQLSKQQIISRSGEISAILKGGQLWQDRVLRIRYQAGTAEKSRLAVVVSRKIGGAVERNRAKRLCREVFRQNQDAVAGTVDMVIIPRAGAPADYSGYQSSFLIFLRQALAEPQH